MKLFALFLFFSFFFLHGEKKKSFEVVSPPSNIDTTVIDTALKIKTLEALELVRKYGEETKVMPGLISQIVNRWEDVIFGLVSKAGIHEISFEKPVTDTHLIILFQEAIPDTARSGWSGHFPENGYPFMSLIIPFVKEKPLELLSAVIFHELLHIHLYLQNTLQAQEEEGRNELICYQMQLMFLTWFHAGVEAEKKVVREKEVVIPESIDFQCKQYMDFCLEKIREFSK